MKRSTSNFASLISTINNRMGKRYDGVQDILTTRLIGEARIMENAVKSLDKVHEGRNPYDTENAHFKRVHLAAQTLKQKVKEATARVHKTQAELANDIENRTIKELGYTENKYGVELRTALLRMDKVKRAKAIAQIHDEGDSASMAAITETSPVLTGIDRGARDQYRQTYMQKHAPQRSQEVNNFLETVPELTTVFDAATQAANNLIDKEKAAMIERQEEFSNSAGDSFKDSFVI